MIILKEPIFKDSGLRNTQGTIWDQYYKNPARYGLPFQILYFLAVEKQLRLITPCNPNARVIVCERSLLSARRVYMRMLEHIVPPVMQKVYHKFFEMGGVRHAMPDEIIYLEGNIDDCHKRVVEKGKVDGNHVFSREYLTRCHELHLKPSMSDENTFRRIQVDPNDLTTTITKIDGILSQVERIADRVQMVEPPRPKILSIEGNVGAGKSSLIRSIKERITREGRKDIIVMEEPIEEWLKVTNGRGENLMQLFYDRPYRYAFAFQTLVAVTTIEAAHRLMWDNPEAKVIICERSLFSSRRIFAQALRDDGAIDGIQLGVYDEILKDEGLNWMFPEKVVYLEVSPEVCLERVKSRNRDEEQNISMEWLREYHGYYNKALGVMDAEMLKVIDGNTDHLEERRNWVDQVMVWCQELVGGEMNTREGWETIGEQKEEDVYPQGTPSTGRLKRRTDGEMPIKVRLGSQVRHVGSLGDTLQQLEAKTREYFPELGDSGIVVSWRPSKDNDWQELDGEEDLKEALVVMNKQGRPVARLRIEVRRENSGYQL